MSARKEKRLFQFIKPNKLQQTVAALFILNIRILIARFANYKNSALFFSRSLETSLGYGEKQDCMIQVEIQFACIGLGKIEKTHLGESKLSLKQVMLRSETQVLNHGLTGNTAFHGEKQGLN
ncbi:hypothetical protein VN23_01535 [Janthinobacterium sp. B9-8]|nr:hypothetical protein [Janthinobacterium sp. B9-8]AMC33380.1 hypothetical protein VN23_01535 [Janthinobacterium sp. B9-8]